MAIVLVAHVASLTGSGATGTTTAAINTTGANLIVISVASYNDVGAPTVSDSKSNSWAQLTTAVSTGSGQTRITMWYCPAPTVDTSHTFTVTGSYPSIAVQAFSGAAWSGGIIDSYLSAGASSSVTTFQPGSIGAGIDNELLVSACALGPSGNAALCSGMSVTDTVAYSASNNFSVGMAYVVQTSHSNLNPTWSDGGVADYYACAGASFKAATMTDQTLLGVGRIWITRPKTQTGVGRIWVVTKHTQTGKSRIQIKTQHTQSGVAAIKNNTVQSLTGVANIQVATVGGTPIGPLGTVSSGFFVGPLAGSSITTTNRNNFLSRNFVFFDVGEYRDSTSQWLFFDKISTTLTLPTCHTQTGKSRIQIKTQHTQNGLANIKNNTVQTQTGTANIKNNTVQTQTGVANIQFITLVAHTSANSAFSGNNFTTSAIDTTGATLLVANTTYYNSAATGQLTDSFGNTWTALPLQFISDTAGRLFYCSNPTVGSGHTFTITDGYYSSLEVAAFSGITQLAPLDVSAEATGSASTANGGSVTPTNANSLVISALTFRNTVSLTGVDSGFTITDTDNPGSVIAGSLAYLIQTTATAENPTWTLSSTANYGVTNAVFIYGTAIVPSIPALIASANVEGNATVTTSGITTTGATLIVINQSAYSGTLGTISDSNSNTWTALTQQNGSTATERLYYCLNPTVGSGHTFTSTGIAFGSLQVLAFGSPGITITFDGSTGTNGTGDAQPGSITPAESTSLVISGLAYVNNSQEVVGLPSGYKIGQLDPALGAPGGVIGGAIGYTRLTFASAQNPTWNFSGTGLPWAGQNAVFAITSGVTTNQTLTGVSRIQIATTKTQTGVANIKNNTTRTLTGVSRIQVATVHTLTGVARIQVATTKTQSGVANIKNNTTRTLTGVARIQVVTNQTQAGKSRIQVTTVHTLTGVSRIQVTTDHTLTGVARIQVSTTRTQTGVANIKNNTTRTLTGVARIQVATVHTLTGVSRIQVTTDHTLTGVSRIQVTTPKTLTGVARIQVVTNQTQAGKSRIQVTTVHTLTGVSRIQVTTDHTLTGVARIQVSTTRTQTGVANIKNNTTRTLTGVARIQVATVHTLTGVSRIQVTTDHTLTGVSRIQVTTPKTLTGVARIQVVTNQTQAGKSRIQVTTVHTLTGVSRIQVTTDHTLTGVARIQVSTTRTQTGVANIKNNTTRTLTGVARIQVATVHTLTGVSRIQVTTDHTLTGVSRIQVTTPKTLTGVARIKNPGSNHKDANRRSKHQKQYDPNSNGRCKNPSSDCSDFERCFKNPSCHYAHTKWCCSNSDHDCSHSDRHFENPSRNHPDANWCCKHQK
jgi:hypothetical protein